MQIFDISQIMNATLAMGMKNAFSSEFEMEDQLRHMILNSIRFNKKKFEAEFGDEIIIACDGRRCWRYEVFPYYKAKRREGKKQQSLIDWAEVYRCFNKIRDELKEYFPYRVIHLENVEADDIIGTICHKFGTVLGGQPILVLSGDKDFAQLQKYANVRQWDPPRKRWIRKSDPEGFLYEHIIRGDAGDGVPNILSPDNIFVSEGRQTPVRAVAAEGWISALKRGEHPKNVFGDIRGGEAYRNWRRNSLLIDLEMTHSDIQDQIMEQYVLEGDKMAAKKSRIFNYFIKYKLKNLMASIGDF